MNLFAQCPFRISSTWLLLGLLALLPPLFAQRNSSSVKPTQVDANYDPLRNRKVNKIIMIRDIRRADAVGQTPSANPSSQAQITELTPRAETTPSSTTTTQKLPLIETPKLPQTLTQEDLPKALTQEPILPRAEPEPLPPELPESKPFEDDMRIVGFHDDLFPVPEAPVQMNIPPSELPPIEAYLPVAATTSRLPRSFADIPTEGYLDNEDYKSYFDAGWNFLSENQQAIFGELDVLNERMDDRKDYIAAGMSLLASQQDFDTTRLNALENRVNALESGTPPATQTTNEQREYYNLGPLDAFPSTADLTAPEASQLAQSETEQSESNTTTTTETIETTTVSETYQSKSTSTDIATEGPAYLIALLDDIIHHTDKYLFWSGYLAEAGPSALRFAEAEFIVNRRDLIPLSTPQRPPLNIDELYPRDANVELITQGSQHSRSHHPSNLKRPDYEGHLSELSRDEVLELLRRNPEAAQSVKVHFQVPNQTHPEVLDTPGSPQIFNQE